MLIRGRKKVIDKLNETNKGIYPGIYILSIFLTMQGSPASSDGSFSAMRRNKTYLRTSMGDEWLSNLSLLHVQRLISIDIEVVIDRFVASKNRKMNFIRSKIMYKI